MLRTVRRRALLGTVCALLIGASGFLLGQQLDGSGSSSGEPLPKRIVTHESSIPIPNLGSIGGFPEISTAAGRRTKRRAP
jgi:hypothetical protein